MCYIEQPIIFPVNIYLSKVINTNNTKRCEICSKLTIKTPERRQWRHSDVFIVNSEHISHIFSVFLLLTLKCYLGWLQDAKHKDVLFSFDKWQISTFLFVPDFPVTEFHAGFEIRRESTGLTGARIGQNHSTSLFRFASNCCNNLLLNNGTTPAFYFLW